MQDADDLYCLRLPIHNHLLIHADGAYIPDG